MAKRKQSKSNGRKGASTSTSKSHSTSGKRRSKKVALSSTVAALFEKTRRRIKQIERRALAKLRPSGGGK